MTSRPCAAGILLSVLEFQKRQKASPNLIGRKHPNPLSDKIVIQCQNKAKPGKDVCGIHIRSKKIIRWDETNPLPSPEEEEPPEEPPESNIQDNPPELGGDSSSLIGEIIDSKGGVCETPPAERIDEEIIRYGYCIPLDTPLLEWTMTEEEQSRWLVEVDTKKVYRVDDEGLGVEKGKLVLHPRGVIIGPEDERYMVELNEPVS